MNAKEMSGIGWDWFVRENGGLQALLSAIDKNINLGNENFVSVLYQFGRYNFMELFTHNKIGRASCRERVASPV